MLGHIMKFFALIFIMFIVVGNITAPPEVTQDNVQADGVLGIFVSIGKYIVVPFKTLEYRLHKFENKQEEYSLEMEQEPPVPKGYTPAYFTYMGRKYKYYKPVNPVKSPVKEKFTFIKLEAVPNWYFTAKDLVKDLNSKPVKETFKVILDGVYGIYDEKDREIYINYTTMLIEHSTKDKKRVEQFKKDSKYAKLVHPFHIIQPLKSLGIPYTPEALRYYVVSKYDLFTVPNIDTILYHKNFEPELPSKVITEGKEIDCDGIVPMEYAYLYHLNKLLGVKAEYYEVIMFGVIGNKVNSEGHAELFVYYPETGTWEIYSPNAISEYFYKYSGRDIDTKKYWEYSKKELIYVNYNSGEYFDESIITYRMLYLDFIVYDPKNPLKVPSVYWAGGKLQFKSFEEALYWYFYNDMKYGDAFITEFLLGKSSYATGIPQVDFSTKVPSGDDYLRMYSNTKFSIVLYKLPTEDDPHVYLVKEWSWRIVSLNDLKEIVKKQGLWDDVKNLKFVIDVVNPPEIIKEPIPIWSEDEEKPEFVKEHIREFELEQMRKKNEKDGGESIIDLLVEGFKEIYYSLRG